MRARLALVLIGGAAVLAPMAHGAGTEPRLVVHGRTAKAASEVILRHVGAANTALVLVPGGYTLTLGQAAGATVGAASADQLVDGGVRTLSGAVTAAPPGTLACDGVAHAATWSVALGDGTQTVATLTVAADAAPAQLLVCLSGSQVDRLTLQLAATVLVPPAQPARPVWEALVSFPDGSQVASVATLALPAKLTLRATYQRIKHLIAVSGVVLEAGAAAPTSRRVVVSIGKQASTLTTIGATRTHPDGSWRGVITNVKRTLYIQAQAVAPETDTTATACTPPTLTAPCVSATSAGYTASSAVVRVAVARPAK